MTSTSTTTGSISSAGIGSGLDVKSIITSLMAVESQPLTLLQTKASTVTTEISSLGQIQSLASTLRDKANALASLSLWNQTVATSADPTSVTASTSSGNASAGDYTVSVQKLAQGQTVTSNKVTSAFNTGTLTIQLGTWSGTPPSTFQDASPAAVPLIIGAADTSLSAIRDKINGAALGVSASIITDGTGSRLSLRSTNTGAANGFKITATEDTDDLHPETGLSSLVYDPSGTDTQLNLNQSANDAAATVNGIPIVSASNTLSNISDGLSLTLLKQTATPIDIGIAPDSTSMQKAVTDFATAYSALNASIHDATKYDASTGVARGTARKDGPLEGDASVIGFQNQLRSIINTTSATSTVFARLSDIGVNVQADGSLAVNATRLTSALAKPAELQKLLATQGSTDTNTGIAVRFANLASSALGINGSLASRALGLRGELSRNATQQQDMQTHLDATQARLTAQYQALDTTMAKMNALSSYVTQQVSLMEK